MNYDQLVLEYLDFEIPPYIRRDEVRLDLPRPARNNVIYTITGVRRCGKTYRMYQLMDDLVAQGVPREKIFHFTFDDDRLEPMGDTTATDVFDAYLRLIPDARQGCYLLFDEIQEAPNWTKFVRRVAEQYPVTVVLTGSSSKLMSRDIPTHLRGRSVAAEMWPLSFREYCDFHQVDHTSRVSTFSSRVGQGLREAFDSYLDEGGFPAVQGLDKTLRMQLLQAYQAEIVTKDVVERFETTSLRVAGRFARNAVRSTGLSFSVNAQLKDIRNSGMSVSTEKAYALLADLEDSHLLFKVTDYELSIKENPKVAYKVYAVDPGLALAVAPASHLDIGQRLETAVFLELKRRYGADRMRVISRYSGEGCPECDFVVGDVAMGEQYQLIQVAAELMDARDPEKNKKRVKRELGNIDAAMRNTGLAESTVVTLYEEEEVQMEHGVIHVVPAWKWFALPAVL